MDKQIAILDIKRKKFVSSIFFPSLFHHRNPGFGLDPYPYPDPDSFETLDTDPDLTNPDPQLWFRIT
jgi:hypothetical protein